MSVFIDCVVCGKRFIDLELFGPTTDSQFAKDANTQGWTISPTRCPEHAGAAGESLRLGALEQRQLCDLPHDTNPWVTYAGLATGGVPFGSGGRVGEMSIRPRPGTCQTHSHYWREPA